MLCCIISAVPAMPWKQTYLVTRTVEVPCVWCIGKRHACSLASLELVNHIGLKGYWRSKIWKFNKGTENEFSVYGYGAKNMLANFFSRLINFLFLCEHAPNPSSYASQKAGRYATLVGQPAGQQRTLKSCCRTFSSTAVGYFSSAGLPYSTICFVVMRWQSNSD